MDFEYRKATLDDLQLLVQTRILSNKTALGENARSRRIPAAVMGRIGSSEPTAALANRHRALPDGQGRN